MSQLYDDDILLWSEQQAALLRRLANGERVNDQLDWENLIEEIETSGRSELRAVESHHVQALLHDLKAAARPLARDVPHWRAEARGHRADARRAFALSMQQKIDLAELYCDVLGRMPESIDNIQPLPVPTERPFPTVEALIAAP